MDRIKAQAKSESKGIKHPQMTQMNTDEKTEAQAKITGSRLTARHDDDLRRRAKAKPSGSRVKPSHDDGNNDRQKAKTSGSRVKPSHDDGNNDRQKTKTKTTPLDRGLHHPTMTT